MNRYDREEKIIELFQIHSKEEMALYPNNTKNRMLFNSIYNPKKFKNWINSSGKDKFPPDFYNDNLKIMMDVMRINDHSFVNEKGQIIDRHSKRESELIKELISKNEFMKDAAKEGRIFITPNPGVRGYDDHNYKLYIEGFERVIKKHIEKIKNYKLNHPGYKVMFFVFDESTPYVKCINGIKPNKPGEIFKAEPHFWWIDNNMLKIFNNSNVDYLIWFAPYKHFDSIEKVQLPCAILYDLSKINNESFRNYNIEDMHSLEM